MPTVGIDADAGEEEAAAARIIIMVVVFMPALVQVRRRCWVCCSVNSERFLPKLKMTVDDCVRCLF